MRITRVHVVNFRCLRDLTTSFEDVTVLVGANGTGKSTLLHALRWFFEGGALEPEDHAGHQADRPVSVGVTFTDFNDADRAALGSYVVGDEATFFRTWTTDAGEKLTGKGLTHPPFNEVRRQAGAMAKREAYRELRDARPELGLPTASSAAAVDAALDDWERDHPDQLEEARVDATHLFGFTGGPRLNGRFDFVMVPAIADPAAQTRDARGTLLRQLLERALGDQSQMRARLTALEGEVTETVREIVTEEGGQALRDLAGGVTRELARLIPGSEVMLEAQPPPVRVPDLSVGVRVADGRLLTGVGHQGHGFQRALLIAIVQLLATIRPQPMLDQGEEPAAQQIAPSLFLALEEPELYQHPLQARHFAVTLAALAEIPGASVQVAYATHSEHFVDPAHYERLRRFQRRQEREWPESEVTRATTDRVAARVREAYDPERIRIRIRMTLRRQVAEAVFAKAAVIAEGDSDVGLLHGLAERGDGEGLDALGIAVVKGHGKRQLLIPWAILTELGIPCYVVFDGDGRLAARKIAQGREQEQAEVAQRQAQNENLVVQRVLGLDELREPATTVGPIHTVFADTLDTEVDAWDGFVAAAQVARDELGDWREKSDDAYRDAAVNTVAEPPTVLTELMARICSLAT
ncbi:MAG TPA: AAA family ATPase [Solirubrobacteraceae bacterium]